MTIPRSLAWVALEVVGIALVCWGVAHWSTPAALVVGGVALIAEAAKLS